MKKLTLLSIVLIATIFAKAQNVAINNDGSTAAPSAMLEVKSTTKGFMMPRVTSAQRTAIASPALGLLVFDTDTKTVWAYDGAAWKNLYTSGGGLSLPFAQSVNTGTSALQITNQGAGAAIEGSSTAQFGIGMTAKATGDASWGLYAFSNGAGSESIRSYADNGTAFHGENNSPTNTNTLMNLLNKGAGMTSNFKLLNANSSSANVVIAGNNLGEQLKIFQTNTLNPRPAIAIENSSYGASISSTSTNGIGFSSVSTNGAGVNAYSSNSTGVIGESNNNLGVWGKSQSSTGVLGQSNTGYGVKGETSTSLGFAGVHGSNTGTAGSGVVGVSNAANTQGVYGTSNNGIGVRGLSTSGTALYGNSTTGYAIETNGKVKIAGGNTNPGAGKVLTSDAQGNATWQQPADSDPVIAFKVKGVIDGLHELPDFETVKVHFNTQDYDLGGGFISFNENGNLSEANVFHAPVNGLYHFDLNVEYDVVEGLQLFDYDYTHTTIRVVRNGNQIDHITFLNPTDGDRSQGKGSTDFILNAGDRLYVTAFQANTASVTMRLSTSNITVFSGHLVRKL